MIFEIMSDYLDIVQKLCYIIDVKILILEGAKMDYFNWLPDELRQKALARVKGWPAVFFPAPYFMKCPKSMHPAWQNLLPAKDGIAVKTGPDFLVKDLIKTLEKYQVEYTIEVIR